MKGPGREHWEQEAANWLAWARTPGHDSYWAYRRAFFDAIVPTPGRSTIDVGCGEGRVSRDLGAAGHRVTAVDSSETLVRAAKAADPRGTYLVADAARLPFGPGSFDVAVAYNSLMDFDDMNAALAEIERVLAPGGTVCLSVTHPMNDAGRFDSRDPGASFVIAGSYLGRRRFDEAFERDGLRMRFFGWAYPLEDYAEALERAGFVIERIREPRPDPDATLGREEWRRWDRVPLFLFIRAVRRDAIAPLATAPTRPGRRRRAPTRPPTST